MKKRYLTFLYANRKRHIIANTMKFYRTTKVTQRIENLIHHHPYKSYLLHEFYAPFFFKNINFTISLRDFYFLYYNNIINFNNQFIKKKHLYFYIGAFFFLNSTYKYRSFLNFFFEYKSRRKFKDKYKIIKPRRFSKKLIDYTFFYKSIFTIKLGLIKIPHYVEINYLTFSGVIIKQPSITSVFKNKVFLSTAFYINRQYN